MQSVVPPVAHGEGADKQRLDRETDGFIKQNVDDLRRRRLVWVCVYMCVCGVCMCVYVACVVWCVCVCHCVCECVRVACVCIHACMRESE